MQRPTQQKAVVSKHCNTYHAVLFSQHQCAIFIALEQRLLESKTSSDGVEDDRLQLLMVANQHYLTGVLERHQRNETFRFHTHSTLVNHNLVDIGSGSQPGTGTGRASAQNYVIVLQFVHTGIFNQLLIVINLIAHKYQT